MDLITQHWSEVNRFLEGGPGLICTTGAGALLILWAIFRADDAAPAPAAVHAPQPPEEAPELPDLKTAIEMAKQRSGRHPPYAPTWKNVDPLALWQAACLWVGEEPHATIPSGTAAYPVLVMLRAAVRSRALKICRQTGNADFDEVYRRDLMAFAAKKGERPSFLFPE